MHCPRCSTENPEGARFCLECGSKLALTCAECGTPLLPEAKFCPECGAQVAARPAVAPEMIPRAIAERLQRLVPQEYAERLLAAGGEMAGERRVVTILFCDVKGSSALARDLDPEDVMEIMNGAFDVLIEPIMRYEGTLARLMGDAVLAFFGAPIAHEDDPERACRAALDIVVGVGEYALRLEEERGIKGFDVRVGINTGLVVVGEVGSDLRVEYTAMGEGINLAARMESAADPGTILITEATHKLIDPLFETQPLEPVAVKGWEDPVAVYRVLASKEVPGKVRGIEGLQSELVGRQVEFAALLGAVARLRAGSGGIVTMVGEAGIGKSRLVAELRKVGAHGRAPLPATGPTPVQWVEGRCLSYGTSMAYLLWLDVLRSALGVTGDALPQAMRGTLRQWVEDLCPQRLDDVYPYLARLMSLPLEEPYATVLDGLEGQQIRKRTFQAVETAMASAARRRPLVMVLEDLHWADPTSLDLLQRLLPLSEQVPLLIIALSRPYQDHASWRLRGTVAETYGDRHVDLLLDPLPSADSQTLVANLLCVGGLPGELTQRILDRAEGNPFYVEEIIRSLLDAGIIVQDRPTGRWQVTQEAADIAIPDTLQGVLVARIDRLREDARRVLQMASVIGRVFLYRLLTAVAAAERQLDAHLASLQQEEMIRERASEPELEYIFKHELTREAAYNGLLKKQRRQFHRQVAQALEELFADRSDELLGLLAHHWELACDSEKAIHYLGQAGERAARVFANQEAIAYLTRGLALLDELPESSERSRQELLLETNLIPPLIAVKGYGDPEVGNVVTRALELGKRVGDSPQLFLPLIALGSFHGVRAEYQLAQRYWGELRALAERVGDPMLMAMSHWLGWIPLFTGEPGPALAHLQQVIDFYDPQKHRSLLFVYGVDPGAICRSWASWALWLLGYPDSALQRSQEALVLAKDLDHPHTLAFTQAIAGLILGQCRREPGLVEEWLEPTLSLCAEHGFAFFEARATASHGWLLVEQGWAGKGIVRIRQGLDGMRATGSDMYVPMELAIIGKAHGKAGRPEQGLTALAEALARAHSTGERLYEPEIHRLRGELLLTQGDDAGAKASFCQAVDVARVQNARSWELRATVSLSRLLANQGQREQARDTLSQVYGWFTEGFDTPDLREAKALLEALF